MAAKHGIDKAIMNIAEILASCGLIFTLATKKAAIISEMTVIHRYIE
jgi:hypothetical protein